MSFISKASFNALILTAVVSAVLLAAGCGGVQSNLASTPGAKPTPTPAPGVSPTPTPVPLPFPTPTPGGSVPHSGHVVLVIEENHTFAQVLASMPWLVSLGNSYA